MGWTRKAIVVLFLLLLLSPAFAQDESRGDYPGDSVSGLLDFGSSASGQRCIMNDQYCFDDTGWEFGDVIGTVLAGEGPLAQLSKEWSETSWSKEFASISFIDAFYGMMGVNEAYFGKMCKNDFADGPVMKWVFFAILMLFYVFFIFFSSKSLRTGKLAKKSDIVKAYQEGQMEIIENICEAVDPDFDVDSLKRANPRKLLNMKFRAAWHAADAFLWRNAPGEKKAPTPSGVSIGSNGSTAYDMSLKARTKRGWDTGVGRSAKDMTNSFAASAAMDVVEMVTILTTYVLPTTIFLAIIWVIISLVPMLTGFKTGTGCGGIFFVMLLGMLWAYWMWEMLRLVLIKGAFLFAMLLPKGLLKFIYVPFIGGDFGSRSVGIVAIILGILGIFSQGISGNALSMLSIIFLLMGIAMMLLNAPVALFFQLFGMAYLLGVFHPLQYDVMEMALAFFAAMMLYAMMLVVFIGEAILLRKMVVPPLFGLVELVTKGSKKLFGSGFKKQGEISVPEVKVPEQPALPPAPEVPALPPAPGVGPLAGWKAAPNLGGLDSSFKAGPKSITPAKDAPIVAGPGVVGETGKGLENLGERLGRVLPPARPTEKKSVIPLEGPDFKPGEIGRDAKTGSSIIHLGPSSLEKKKED